MADAKQFKGRVAVSLGTLDDPEVMDKLKPEKELYVGMRTKVGARDGGTESREIAG